MTLFGATGELDKGAAEVWRIETQDRIRGEAARTAVGDDGEDPYVTVRFDGQDLIDDDDGRRTLERADDANGPDTPVGYLRRLRSSSLRIYFVTAIELHSEGDDDWDPSEMVVAGFRTPSQREEYLDALKASDVASSSRAWRACSSKWWTGRRRT